MKPMLADQIDPAAIDFYLTNDSWWLQQKLDGQRLVICAGENGVKALNRDGDLRSNPVPRKVLRQFDGMPGNWCFDGELLDGELWLFDMPVACDHVTPDLPLEYRLSVLERFFSGWKPDSCIRLLPTARSTAEKKRLLSRVKKTGAEGLMIKHTDGLYRPGRRSQQMLKVKYTATCDAFVNAINVDGKTNCHYSVYDENGQPVEIGSCATQGKPKVALGDVIELRYLYCSEDNRLVQPRMLRVRTDKAPAECTIDQLAFTDRTVQGVKVNRQPWRRCLTCSKPCHWSTTWTCTGCSTEWNQTHDRRYAVPTRGHLT